MNLLHVKPLTTGIANDVVCKECGWSAERLVKLEAVAAAARTGSPNAIRVALRALDEVKP